MNNRALFKQLIEFKYQSIIDYNLFVENNVKKSVADIEKQYDEFVKDNPAEMNSTDETFLDYHMSYIDDLAYESQKLSVEIIQKHRQSTIFQFYSLLEKQFYQISSIVGSESLFKITELKGSLFEQFKLYLKKIDPELLGKISSYLAYFDKIRVVRNCITHNDSILRSNMQHFKQIKEFSYGRFTFHSLGINKDKIEVCRIELDNKKFIDEIFDNFKIFIDKVYE